MRLPDFIIDPLIRRKARLHETPLDRFKIRVARTAAEYEEAFQLLHVAYVYQGIESVRSEAMRITDQHVLPESTVLVAYEGDMLVGTMTVTLDSPAGLPLDKDYGDELKGLRERGARLVEIGSLAVVKRCWRSGVATLLNMAGHWLSRNVLKATHCVIGVNPRVTALHRAVFCFRPLGEAKPHAELTAPVQGLVQEFEEARAHVRRHFRRRFSTGLLPHEHYCEQLPACIEVPPAGKLEDFVRWKLPREVFRALFIEQTDHLDRIDSRTREHLEGWRTIRTLARAEA